MAALGLVTGLVPIVPSAQAKERVVRIVGFGAKSGIARVFGHNSEAALRAAAEEINNAGGVKLGDGGIGKLAVEYFDDKCNAVEGETVVRRIESTDAIIAIGPTCSSVAEALFASLQKKAGDTADPGMQIPIMVDVATRAGLTGISEWAFRNVRSEAEMYRSLFAWIKTTRPDLKTFFVGVEKDFGHSRAVYRAIKEAAVAAGFQMLGETDWLHSDTTFANQIHDMKRSKTDIVVIGAHPNTTCGLLKEMDRKGLKPRLTIGLTSSATLETLQGCGPEAEGMVIPTSFAPVTPSTVKIAEAIGKQNGSADLHSAAAYEIVYILKSVIESKKIVAKPDTVFADRIKMRDGLAALTETDGLLGKIRRTPDREAIKPTVFVQAKDGAWLILHKPAP